MVNVRFYGSLSQFGTHFQLDCRDVAEIICALTSQYPKLRQALQQGLFKVRIGRHYIDNRYVEKGLYYRLKAGMTVHFTPVLKGAKRAGVFNIIVGIALVAASWYAGGAAGWSYLGASGYGMATMGTMLGASMILSGVAQLLTSTPKMGGISEDKEKQRSTSFSNLSNMTAQGKMIPLAYGRIRTGSLVISQGVETYDVETAVEENKPVGFRKGRMN